MKVAVVGGGVAGLTAAYLLHRIGSEVVVFESEPTVGGHAKTERVETEYGPFDVDTGFMVFNRTTYPLFRALLETLEVGVRETSMSFGVQDHRTGLEYCGTSLDTLFAQRRNVLSLSFIAMIRDVVRFNREASALLERGVDTSTLGEWIDERGYGKAFRERYLLPMGAAIWSSSPKSMMRFPAKMFLEFFRNHGLLSVDGHFTWCTIDGGSRRYVEALTAAFRERIRVSTPVAAIRRREDGVDVSVEGTGSERFDHVVLACHSDQALAMLADPSDEERDVLGSIAYQENTGWVHTDRSMMPRSRRAWASWNYHVPEVPVDSAYVTYDLDRLQGLGAPGPVCLTLNWSERIDPDRIVRTLSWSHPVFTPEAWRARERFDEISGVRRTHYCGAYWRNGFHEDGVWSAYRACRALGVEVAA